MSSNNPRNKTYFLPLPNSPFWRKYQIVTNYKIIETIFGILCLAQELHTGFFVAVKFSREDLIAKKKTCSGNFVEEDPHSEVKLVKELQKHNIPRLVLIQDSGSDNRIHWTVTPWFDGGDVFEIVQKHFYELSNTLKAKWTLQMAETLQGLHQAGFAHLDVSLENFLLDTQTNDVYLTDFGVTRKVKTDQSASFRWIGKPPYQPPEFHLGQLEQEMNLFAADIFSFGVCVYMMHTRARLYAYPRRTDRHFDAFMKYDFKFLMTNVYRVPIQKDIMDLLASMLDRNPSARISAEDVQKCKFLQIMCDYQKTLEEFSSA